MSPRKAATEKVAHEKVPATTPSIGPVPPSTLETAATPAPTTSTPATPAPATPTGLSELQDRLDMVLLYLHKMDRRDKWRTRGGFLRGLISIIPVLIAVWAAWYFYMYGDILMKKLTMEVVRQSAAYSESTLEDRMQKIVPLIEGLNLQPAAEQSPPGALPPGSSAASETLLPE